MLGQICILIDMRFWEDGAPTSAVSGDSAKVSNSSGRGDMLWEGFLRLTNMLGKSSFPILLRLPVQQLKKALIPVSISILFH